LIGRAAEVLAIRAAASISASDCALAITVDESRAASVSAAVVFVVVISISLGHKTRFVTISSYCYRVTVSWNCPAPI